EDLDDAAAGQPAHAQRDVETERTGGDRFDVPRRGSIAKAHHRALAELLFDLTQRGGERLLAIVIHAEEPLGIRAGIIPQMRRARDAKTAVFPCFFRRSQPPSSGQERTILYSEPDGVVRLSTSANPVNDHVTGGIST